VDSSQPLITTYLEMRSPGHLRPKRVKDARFQIREETERDWRFNRDLYFAVGEQWQWIDKRSWSDAQWQEYTAAPPLRTFAAYYEAWSRRGGVAPKRVWVHTCNLDHPQALANYQARGMVIYKVEETQP